MNGTGQYPIWVTRNPEKGDFRELKSKTFTGGVCPWTPKKLAFSALVEEMYSLRNDPDSKMIPHTELGIISGAVGLLYFMKVETQEDR